MPMFAPFRDLAPPLLGSLCAGERAALEAMLGFPLPRRGPLDWNYVLR